MRYFLLLTILITTPAYAYNFKTDKTLKGVAGKVDADITYSEMDIYFKKIEDLIDAWCSDYPVLFSPEQNKKREKVCG